MNAHKKLVRFWDRVQPVKGVRRLAFPGCWEWQGGRWNTGYGKTHIAGKPIGAHRYAWEQEHGPIPDGLHVCHHCDNRRCVRPDHLFLGSARDNSHDMMRKGRGGNRPGEDNSYAKLTEEQVREIREQYRPSSRWSRSGRSQQSLARAYGVHQTTVAMIVRGKLWPSAGGPITPSRPRRARLTRAPRHD